MKQTTTQFDFAAKPKVTALKPKYREREDMGLDGTNLMNDPRVIRGNTYAAVIANKNQIQPPPLKKTNNNKPQRKKLKQRRINFDTGFEPTTPRAIDGRDHFTTQTQPFVQTLRDKPIQYEKECQTDLFLDRPVQRAFNAMAQKVGVDRNTQVDEHDPELFNFDYEVQPILDALLSKVLESSRMQLHEQAQMKQKQEQKINYEKRRHILLAQAQQLEANQNRLRQQYQRRQLQYRKSKQQDGHLEKKVIGRILSKQYLKNLQENTELILQHNGFFRSPLQLDLLQEFEPWLYQQIIQELKIGQETKEQVEKMIKQSQENVLKQSNTSLMKQANRKKQILDERERKKQQKLAKIQEKKRIKQEQERKRKEEQEAAKEAENQQAAENPSA